MEKNGKNSKTVEKVRYLDEFLKSQDLDMAIILHTSRKTINSFYKNKDLFNSVWLRKLSKYFLNVKHKDLIDDSVDVKDLPDYTDLLIQQKTKKIRILNKFLKDKENIDLYRAISVSENKMANYLSGHTIPSRQVLTRIATYFFLDNKMMLDDSVELPPLDKIILDEDLVSIQRNDVESQLEKNKTKHYVSRNWRVLGYKKRVKLIVNLVLVALPLVAYTSYCAYKVINNRNETYEKYQKNIEKNPSLPDEDIKNMPEDEVHADVKIGSQLHNINSVNANDSSYKVEMRVWFDFNQLEYHEMFYKKYNNCSITESPYSEHDKSLWNQDKWYYNKETGEFQEVADNIPDVIQMEDITIKDPKDGVVNPLYLLETSMYPGTTSSNVYPTNQNMWIIGNGDFDADTHLIEMERSYTLTNKETGEKEFRTFQKSSFIATITKKFDNPRYPLDSVQFHIYILPMQLTTEYVRYVPTDIIDLSSAQTIGNKINNKNYTCSIDENIYETGVSPYFGITGGYKLIQSDKFDSLVYGLSYYKDNDQQLLSRTEYEIIVRANREGLSLFLQAFINLFSIIIWITIAFYNQAYNSEDAIGMLGTGLFGAISSILVGISMISDANIFSLITMVNIFTLAVIMIMTWESIAAKRAKVLNDKVAIAYRGIKLRVLFILLAVSTLIMFIGLPIASYIWEFGAALL